MTSTLIRWWPAMLLVAAMSILAAPEPARAVLVLEGTLTPSGGAPITIFATDNNVPYPGGPPPGGIQLLDQNPALDFVTLAPALGAILPGFSIQSFSAFDTKAPGNNSLNLIAVGITNTTGDTVTVNIQVGDNDFLAQATTASVSANGTFTNAIGTNLNASFFDDPANAQPLLGPTPTIPGDQIALVTKPVTLASDTLAFNPPPIPVNDPSNFSMTLHFDFSLINNGTITNLGQGEIKTASAVPAPTTVTMVVIGLPLVGLFVGRRRRALRG